jgi:hypothetical protein
MVNNKIHDAVKPIAQSCLTGVLIAASCLLLDLFTQTKREAWVIIIRSMGLVILCVLVYWYRKLELYLPDKTAKKPSFKLWAQCAIVLGALYVGVGYGLFLGFLLFFIFIPFINIDWFPQLLFDVTRILIIVGVLFGNAVYLTCVLKWEFKKDSVL